MYWRRSLKTWPNFGLEHFSHWKITVLEGFLFFLYKNCPRLHWVSIHALWFLIRQLWTDSFRSLRLVPTCCRRASTINVRNSGPRASKGQMFTLQEYIIPTTLFPDLENKIIIILKKNFILTILYWSLESTLVLIALRLYHYGFSIRRKLKPISKV